MDWTDLDTVLVLFGTPTVIGVAIGLVDSVRFLAELDEARTLSRAMCRELDDARYELEQLQDALDHADDEPPTTELPALRPVPRDAAGRHRLRVDR